MIVESWLNDRCRSEIRGSLFSVYMATGLMATTAGQLILGASDPKGYEMVVLAGMAYMLAIIPTAVTQSVSLQPLVQSRLDLNELWRNSPVAVAAVLAIEIANSAFGTLAAVYTAQFGYSTRVTMGLLIEAQKVPKGLCGTRVALLFSCFGTSLVLSRSRAFKIFADVVAFDACAEVGRSAIARAERPGSTRRSGW